MSRFCSCPVTEGATRRAIICDEEIAALSLLQRHVSLVHGEFRLVTADDEMGGPVRPGYVGKLEHHAHHAGVDFPVLAPVSEDGIGLPRSSAVQLPVGLPLLAPDAEGALEADLRADDLVQHFEHFRVIDKKAGRPAGHGAQPSVVTSSLYVPAAQLSHPSWLSFLHAHRVPEYGRDTLFADMDAAYDRLYHLTSAVKAAARAHWPPPTVTSRPKR